MFSGVRGILVLSSQLVIYSTYRKVYGVMKYIDLIYVYVASNHMYLTSLYFGAQNHDHDYAQYQD